MPGVYYTKSSKVGREGRYVGFATGTMPNPNNTNKTSYVPAFRFSGDRSKV